MTSPLWITQLTPDLRSRDATRDLRDAVRLHHRIMSLFPSDLGEQARHDAGVLFRIEETQAGVAVLVQSAVEASRAALPDGYGTVRSKTLTPLLDALAPGRRVRYRITANATRKLGLNTTAGRPKEVVPLHGAEAEEWWQRQAESSGLSLHTLESTPLDQATGTRRDKNRVVHARTRFDGLATVTDPAALSSRLRVGIGRGKAYGCGLLTLAPA
ncbi:type I-E CRISPR-associated protein Cas6/Cse3/CasE [Actinocorallia sp. A-T 12471]|uniref:type I-E CRISPR-associated protein Cas6/Cse3/CasE n=1 Tax=Actinocorallia sp. A-T 12471 TaxID=3089813 RepID=UPI0029CD11E6|nr:type I-E CRISPR-associated protein Cas6/Cse3/CasE [Actinocorallia sp. A-T 12471]MDX6740250.1 type I-E CRISPR-associated protein Cas6/Cse3/CasE [Actinocorallia sp. A-T 12471]